MIDYDCRDDLSISQNFYKHVRLYSPFHVPESYTYLTPHHTFHKDNQNDSGSSNLNSYEQTFKRCVSFNTAPMRVRNADIIDKKYTSEFPGVQLPKEIRGGNILSDKYAISRFLASSMREYPVSGSTSDINDYNDGNINININNSSIKSVRKSEHGKRMIQMVRKFGITEEGKIVREDYPSRPSTTNDSMVISRESGNWLEMWKLRKEKYNERVDEAKFDRYFVFPEVLFKSEIDAEERQHRRKVASWMDTDGYTPISKDTKRKIMVLSEVVGSTNLPRVVLCRIDGRKHTWVALDWLITKFVQSVDHIVIVTNLPAFRRSSSSRCTLHSNGNRARSRNFVTLDHNYSNNTSTTKLGTLDNDNRESDQQEPVWERAYKRGYDREMLRETVDRIWKYTETLLLINKTDSLMDKPVKVTIELTIGKTMDVMCDMINIYTPDLMVIGNLNTESLTKWKSQYLSDLVYSKFPIPVIEVPVLMMNAFEKALVKEAERLSEYNGNLGTEYNQLKSDNQSTPSANNALCRESYMKRLDEIIDHSFKTVPRVPETSHIHRQMVDIAASPAVKSMVHSNSSNTDTSFRQSKSNLIANATATGTTVTTKPLTSITSSQMKQMYNRSRLLSQQHAFKSSTAIPNRINVGSGGSGLTKVTSDPSGRLHVNIDESSMSLPVRRTVTGSATTNTNDANKTHAGRRTSVGTNNVLHFGWPLRRVKSDRGSEPNVSSISAILDGNDNRTLSPMLSEGHRRSHDGFSRRGSHPLSSHSSKSGSILDAVEGDTHVSDLRRRRWSDERRGSKSVGFFASFFRKGRN